MHLFVDMSRCETHAQCVFAAPEVFALDDDDALVYEPEPSQERRAEIEQAARACPVQAIFLDGDRP
ncbi:ferredoxin [Glycomyces tarimensis]